MYNSNMAGSTGDHTPCLHASDDHQQDKAGWQSITHAIAIACMRQEGRLIKGRSLSSGSCSRLGEDVRHHSLLVLVAVCQGFDTIRKLCRDLVDADC